MGNHGKSQLKSRLMMVNDGSMMVSNHWLVVTGTMEFGLTFQKQLGMECHHPK
jgi:hypothetical protein